MAVIMRTNLALLVFWTIAFQSLTVADTADVELGIEKVAKSYEMACQWTKDTRDCQGLQDELIHKIKTKFYFKRNPDRKEIYFQNENKRILRNLPVIYQEKCLPYLRDTSAKPLAEESEMLEDHGQNFPFKAYAHCLLSVLREVSKGFMIRDANINLIGMEKTVQAYEMACDYELSENHCVGQQAKKKEQALSHSKDKDEQMKVFSSWSKDALNVLGNPYKEKCGTLLSDPDIEAAVDESEILKDGGKQDYPLKAYAHCLVHTLREHSNGVMKRDWNEILHFGMDKSIQAFDMVCDYEISAKECKGQQSLRKEQVLNHAPNKDQPKKQMSLFGAWSKDALAKLPAVYKEKCQEFLSKPGVMPTSDESKVLDDAGKTYPFMAYAHCLVHALREASNGAMKRNR